MDPVITSNFLKCELKILQQTQNGQMCPDISYRPEGGKPLKPSDLKTHLVEFGLCSLPVSNDHLRGHRFLL